MALYSLSQRQFLYNAINERYPDAIAPMGLENAIIGIPKAITVTADGANTEIVIRGRQGRGYIGAQTFRYKRLLMSDLFKNMVAQTTSPTAYGWLFELEKRAAFAQNLNGRYGLNLVAEDIPETYVSLNITNIMTIKTACLQYTGGFTYTAVRGKYDLSELALNDIMPGLSHPIEVQLDKKYMGFLTYGIDFTEEVQVMASFKNGRLDVGSNFDSGCTANLMACLAARGIPTFDPTGVSISRYKASIRSGANKAYDNVLYIGPISKDNNVAGDCLLHYNN